MKALIALLSVALGASLTALGFLVGHIEGWDHGWEDRADYIKRGDR